MLEIASAIGDRSSAIHPPRITSHNGIYQGHTRLVNAGNTRVAAILVKSTIRDRCVALTTQYRCADSCTIVLECIVDQVEYSLAIGDCTAKNGGIIDKSAIRYHDLPALCINCGPCAVILKSAVCDDYGSTVVDKSSTIPSFSMSDSQETEIQGYL
jgi:hypothetical protein